jgi:hypothetical protein
MWSSEAREAATRARAAKKGKVFRRGSATKSARAERRTKEGFAGRFVRYGEKHPKAKKAGKAFFKRLKEKKK